MRDNPFIPMTDAEKENYRLKRREAEMNLKETVEAAKDCLSNELFANYKKKYNIAKKAVIDDIIEYRNSDPIKYAFYISNQLNSLRSLSTLLNEVEKDARA